MPDRESGKSLKGMLDFSSTFQRVTSRVYIASNSMTSKIKLHKDKWEGNKPSLYAISQLNEIRFDKTINTINDRLRQMRGMSPFSYTSMDKRIEKANELLEELCYYIGDTLEDIDTCIDEPFYERFNNKVGILESFEKIQLDGYETKNRLGIKERGSKQVYDYPTGTYKNVNYENAKESIGFKDILNNMDVEGYKGMPTFAQMMEEQYESIVSTIDNELSYKEYVEAILHRSNISHTVDRGWLNYVSDGLDIIGIPSAVSIFTGTNFITGEILTESEKEQAIFNTALNIGTLAITIATAGSGSIAAVGINGAIKKTALAVGKTLVVDMSSGIAGMVTMDLLEGAGSPEWLTKVAGLGVSFIGGYYGEKTINSIENYSSLGKMSAKDGKRYQAYFDDIVTGNHLPPGITDVENVKYLQGIEKLEEINALHTIDYEKIVKVSKEIGGVKTIDFVDYLKIDKDSRHNVGKDKVMLGKYDGGGSSSYITKAGSDYEYFDLGKDWDVIKKKYDFTDDDMFKLFNESFLEDGVIASKMFQFSHNPINDTGALGKEYQFLRSNNYIWDENTMTMRPMF